MKNENFSLQHALVALILGIFFIILGEPNLFYTMLLYDIQNSIYFLNKLMLSRLEFFVFDDKEQLLYYITGKSA